MITIILSLALEPDPLDLQEFPHPAVVWEQVRLCRGHVRRLEAYRSLRGWEGGRWDAALAETRRRLVYWEHLHAAQAARGGPRSERECLARLWRLLGPERYRGRWHPPLLPPGLPPVPGAARPAACGANGCWTEERQEKGAPK